ncbi:MAG: hypothetical protein IIU10_03645, partial [Paludibacteraceae bacterium]|nr:hypothetical protein [Paludibacteraceae bacterium]
MKNSILFVSVVAAFVLTACGNNPQQSANPADHILLKDFKPEVVNNIPMTQVDRAKFDIIDMHSHDYVANEAEIATWCKTMDEVGVLNTAIMHCSWIGRPFEEVIELYAPYKDHFRFWCCFDYTGIDTDEWPACGIKALERCKELGAVGIGELGDKGEGDTYARPMDGKDIHIAEPYWMYLPMDEKNDGLVNAVNWHVDTTACYGYEKLMTTFENAV